MTKKQTIEFLDYKDTVENLLKAKASKFKSQFTLDLDDLFDAYINDIKPEDYIKKGLALKESIIQQNNKYEQYFNNVVNIISKSGYKINIMPMELAKEVVEFYNEGYTPSVPANYCVEQIKKNSIKISNNNINTDGIKNRLLYALHDIDNCAIKNIEMNGHDIFAILKIKIFEMRNEISTDVKSYIRELHKNFIPYIRQNIDNNTRMDILGYSIEGRSVFITIKMKIDVINTENATNVPFSIKETVNIIDMYVNIFRTFAEQYRNII